MHERDYLGELSSAVASYVRTLQAVGDCLAAACPAVGAAYRQRIHRLGSRLIYDASREAVTESAAMVATELKDYGVTASSHMSRPYLEVERGTDALRQMIQSLAASQNLYALQLQQLAARMETAVYPHHPEQLVKVIAAHVAELRDCAAGIRQGAGVLCAHAGEELDAISARLSKTQIHDPYTGLLSRSEMERQIEVRKANEITFTLLVFQLNSSAGEDLLRKVAARLETQFRAQDLIARWDDKQFLVLFLGVAELAQARAAQALQQITGPYTLDDGTTVQIDVELCVAAPELAAA